MIDWNDVGAETGRFTLGEDGQIFWQTNKTNPMPGELVATIIKGDVPLTPKTFISTDEAPYDAQGKIENWLHAHIKEILMPLFTMMDQETEENRLEGPAVAIGQKLFDAMGVIHRSELEGDIPNLTPDHRTALRRKRVKLGPILVFMPELVKPAAVNIRALLYGLWHSKTLPMERPADGRVSVTIDPEAVDRNYFRSIGYPIFGAKAIRIDMLDRVITDIYDSSKDWQFRAKHQYMEWLGCGEEDLYAILQSMGFRRQMTESQNLGTLESQKDEVPQEVKVIEEAPVVNEENRVKENEEETEAKSQTEKPPLAIFWLKKGKISDRPPSKRYKSEKQADKKPSKGKKKKVNEKGRDFKAKNYSAKPKDDEIDTNSPFAILQQLKK